MSPGDIWRYRSGYILYYILSDHSPVEISFNSSRIETRESVISPYPYNDLISQYKKQHFLGNERNVE